MGAELGDNYHSFRLSAALHDFAGSVYFQCYLRRQFPGY